MKKEIKSWKRKESHLLILAKLHAFIKNANLERIKLPVQSIRLRIPEISETEQIKFEIQNKSFDDKYTPFTMTLLQLFQILATKLYLFSKI